MHRYDESRQGRPGDTKILALDPLKARGRQVTALQAGESITVEVLRGDGTVYLPETHVSWQVIHEEETSGAQVWAWAYLLDLPAVTTKETLTVIWRVRLASASRTLLDAIEVIP